MNKSKSARPFIDETTRECLTEVFKNGDATVANDGINYKSVSEFLTKQYIDNFLTGSFPSATPITNYLNLPKLGSHLVTPRTGFTHHGIYVGKETVVHYSGLHNGSSSGQVEEISLQQFCDGQTLEVKLHQNSNYTREQIVERAYGRINEQEYDLIFNNCEHFVNWCIYNVATSRQVEAFTKTVVHSAIKTTGRSNLATNIVTGISHTGLHIKAYINGDISKEKLFEEISHTVVTTTSTLFYTSVGQAAIPIPVVGALVGASIGYFIGNRLHGSGLIALGDSQVVREAKERRREIEAMCNLLIPEIKNSRKQLKNYIEQYFSTRRYEFSQSFKLLEDSLGKWDPDSFVGALEKINNQFGKTLQFKSFEEFDSFMKSDETFYL